MPVLKNFDLILLRKSPVLFFTHLIGVTTETEKDYLFILKVLIKYPVYMVKYDKIYLHLQVNSRKQSQAILPLKSEGHETSEALKWHSLSRNDKGKFLNFWPWRKTLRIKFLQSIYKSIYLQSGIYDNHLVGSR